MSTTVDEISCNNCGQPAHIERGDFPFIRQGGLNVNLYDIELIVCKACGNIDPIIPKLNDLMRTITAAIVSKPYRLTGAEARFLRKHLGMTGDAFSRLLHVDKTTISKWENDEDPIGGQSDLLIRSIVLLTDEKVRRKMTAKPEEKLAAVKEARREMPINIDSRTASFGYANAAGLLPAFL